MQKERKQLLVFGYGMAVILSFISFRVWRHVGWVPLHSVLLFLAVLFVFVTKFREEDLKPIYKKWMRFVHAIGFVITTVILSLVFYLMFGVAGIILRLLRKDLLNEKIEPNVDSYWIKREKAAFDKEHYTRQF